MRIPDQAIVKKVLNMAFAARVRDAGGRCRELAVDGNGIKSSGEINWGLVGPYKLVWGEARAVSIVHRPTGDEATIDLDIVITGDFKCKDFHSDSAAMLIKGPRRHRLSDFFSKPLGPWKCKVLTGKSEVFMTLVGQAAQTHSDAQAALNRQDLKFDEAEYQKPLKEKAAAATKRAREALALSKAEREATRRKVASDCS